MRARHVLIVVVLAVLLAPVGDWGHVVTGTTTYDWDPGPHLGRSSWWFLLAIAAATAGACLVYDRLSRWLEGPTPRPAAPGSAVAAVGGTMAIYGASALLLDARLGVADVTLLAAAAVLWALADATRVGLLTGLYLGTVGTVGEIVIHALGAFHYAGHIDTLGGVPPWLPAIHFSFGVGVAALLRTLGAGVARR
jgi:hypothetical protein